MHHRRVLFILKYREFSYGDTTYTNGTSSGLLNSARFVVNMLRDSGVEAKLVQVMDNNDIDREVSKFKPTDCILEAYWVIPEKFDVLKKLHPHVRWIVRNHSKSSFLSNEGVAFEWSIGYLKRGIHIAPNSPEAFHDFKILARSIGVSEDLVTYLPNYYPVECHHHKQHNLDAPETINIGCFGAIRPLKNQLLQAIAAIDFANKNQIKLFFHINGTRVEGGGGQIIKNLRALFADTEHELVEHDWLDHHAFIRLIANMDYVMAVSYSETFCIVVADAVACRVPVVVSDQIPFLTGDFFVDPNDAKDMERKLHQIEHAWFKKTRTEHQLDLLKEYCEMSKDIWLHYLKIPFRT